MLVRKSKDPVQSPLLSDFTRSSYGADSRNRTDDLILTKDVLCRLSHISLSDIVLYHITDDLSILF